MTKNFNILGVHGKIRVLGRRGGRGGRGWRLQKNNISAGIALKGRGLGQFADLRRGLRTKEGVVFLREGGVDIPMYTMSVIYSHVI